MATVKEEIVGKIENFEKLSIEQTKEGRKVTIDGKELDLSKIYSLEVNMDVHKLILETHSIKYRDL